MRDPRSLPKAGEASEQAHGAGQPGAEAPAPAGPAAETAGPESERRLRPVEEPRAGPAIAPEEPRAEPAILPEPPPPAPFVATTGVPARDEAGSHEEATGVRRRAEAGPLTVRWGAVIAGVAIAIGAHVLLASFALAVGLRGLDPLAPNPRLLAVAGVGLIVAALLAVAAGSYATTRLSGARTRRDGLLAGLVTWAAFVTLGAALTATGPGSSLGTLLQSPWLRRGPPADSLAPNARVVGAAERAAWGTFTGAALTLLAALGAGVAAAGTDERRARRAWLATWRDREEAYRRARDRELDREERERAAR